MLTSIKRFTFLGYEFGARGALSTGGRIVDKFMPAVDQKPHLILVTRLIGAGPSYAKRRPAPLRGRHPTARSQGPGSLGLHERAGSKEA